MPSSMTAFARHTFQFDWGTATWELRSVNHRFLEAHFRLPETVRDQEMLLREAARKQLNRGKLDCQLQLQMAGSSNTVEVDIERAKQYVAAAEQVAGLINNSAPLSALMCCAGPA